MIITYLRQALPTDIGLRIFCRLAAAIIVAVSALGIIFYTIHEKQLVAEQLRHGQAIASLLADALRPGLLDQNADLLKPPVESLSRQPELVSVCIYNKRSELLYARQGPAATGPAGGSACHPAGAAGSMIFRQEVLPGGEPSAEGGQPDRQAIGSVLVRLSDKQLAERRQALLKQNLMCWSSFLAILLVLSLLIVQRATRPLHTLLRRLREKLPRQNGTASDLDTLDHSFTTMLSELENAFRTIEALKTHLGRKVEARTEELQRINANLENTVVELKAAQRQLIHSEKMAGLGLLATGLAHEINNSLVLIKGSFYPLRKAIEQLERRCRQGIPPDPAETTVAELFQHIDTGVFRITSLLTDLMTFARPGNSSRKLIDINNELEMTLRLLHVVSGKEITFVKDFSPVHPVLCHESQIAQVFFNILLNAIQAIDRAGCIRIATAVQDQWIVITFADNGPGIGPELLDKIFDPFFTTKETGSGTGLGLSICYAIINEHGGEIEVTSEVGKGTVFTIRLPKYLAAAGTDAGTAKGRLSRAPYCR